MMVHGEIKSLVERIRCAFYDGHKAEAHKEMMAIIADDAEIKFCEPFGHMKGADALWQHVYAPLFDAFSQIEKRDFIFMAGPRWNHKSDDYWIGFGGNIIGNQTKSWLGIPASQQTVFMRYHEYWRVQDGRIVEIEAIWDIPQLMMQAGVWPMAPQNGAEWMCPAPAMIANSAALNDDYDKAHSEASLQLVWDMLHELAQGSADNPSNGLGPYWNDKALWYGSTAIGSAMGHDGITRTVLAGFRQGLSENTRRLDDGVFFAENDLVAFTGWPSATAKHSGQGFLGLAPTGKVFERRSLDFWRVENGLIRENWVMVDIIDIYRQLGVNLFAHLDNHVNKESA